ncbi:DUF6600 domain-containing protein [Niveibacterium umoris]|nr:DUF6600 domain-containing protein [Niveibacterium umoris]
MARAFGGLVLALAMSAQVALAQEPDPPGRVGRLSYAEGRTEAWTEDRGDWAPIGLNTPVTSRTGLWTSANGRAEVRVGSTAVRLDADSQANFNQIDDAGIAIEVPRGVLRVRLRTLPDDDRLVLSAAQVRVEAQRAGDYRIEHDPGARRVSVTVYAGRARIDGVAERLTLLAGQRVDLDLVDSRMLALGEAVRSSFDDWSERRDREQDRLASSRYVSPEMTGIEALDGHGRWEEDRQYGPLWYPVAVAPGWAPYRYGHWAWIAPWGWTWVDDAPWGFAPFHYGRWVLVDGRWGWAPGTYVARPVYAPALVGFYGGNVGIGVGVGVRVGPVVGWFPLGPWEPYRPPHHCSDDYYRRVNITHVNVTNVNITNINGPTPRTPGGPNGDRPIYPNNYRYATQRDAATFVSRDDFTGARPIRGSQGSLPDPMIRQLPVVAAPPTPAGRPALPAQGNGARDPHGDMWPNRGGPGSAPVQPPPGPARSDAGSDTRTATPAMVPLDPSRRAPDGSLRPGPMVPVQPVPGPTRPPVAPTMPVEREVRPQTARPIEARPATPSAPVAAPVDPVRDAGPASPNWRGRVDVAPERQSGSRTFDGGRDPHAPQIRSEPSAPSAIPRPNSAPVIPMPPRQPEVRVERAMPAPVAPPVQRAPEVRVERPAPPAARPAESAPHRERDTKDRSEDHLRGHNGKQAE